MTATAHNDDVKGKSHRSRLQEASAGPRHFARSDGDSFGDNHGITVTRCVLLVGEVDEDLRHCVERTVG